MSYKKYADLGKPNEYKIKKPDIKITSGKTQNAKNTTEQFVMPKKHKQVVFHLESKEHLDKLLKKHRVIVVDTWANWCGPCKRIAPEFENLARQHQNNKRYPFC